MILTLAAAGLAVTYTLLGVVGLTVLIPRSQTASAGTGTLSSPSEHGTGWWLTARWLFLSSSLLGLGIVTGLRRLVPRERAALVDWAAAAGALGVTAVALDQTRLIFYVPLLVRADVRIVHSSLSRPM